MRRGLLALSGAGLLLAVGCGDEAERPAQAPPATQVTVVVHPSGDGGPARRRTVGCGDQATCRKLRDADFAPTGPGIACTQIYGGAATARVTGRVDGRPVRASFNLTNGCEIARWNRLAWLLGAAPRG